MKAVVLVSGGLDSATCLALAVDRYGSDNVTALSVLYGQRHDKELQSAQAICDYYKVKRYQIDISNIMSFSNCALLKHSTDKMKYESYEEQTKETNGTPINTYVPFRNGLMLSCAASIAIALFPNEKVELVYGAHRDDAAGSAYPDCSIEFITSMAYALSAGSGKQLSLITPFAHTNKAAIVKTGLELKVPYELTWSCYDGSEKACGKCGTCIDRIAAFKSNGVEDPIEYEGE